MVWQQTTFPWLLKGVSATLQSGRYTLLYPRQRSPDQSRSYQNAGWNCIYLSENWNIYCLIVIITIKLLKIQLTITTKIRFFTSILAHYKYGVYGLWKCLRIAYPVLKYFNNYLSLALRWHMKLRYLGTGRWISCIYKLYLADANHNLSESKLLRLGKMEVAHFYYR